jgi:hypothetical protein
MRFPRNVEIEGSIRKIEGFDEFIQSIRGTKPKSGFKIVTEYCHPSGPVRYYKICGCSINHSPNLFDIEYKVELRQV